MSQTDRHYRPAHRRYRVWDALSAQRGQRRSKGYAVRHDADAADGKLDIQPHSTGDGDLTDRRRQPSPALERSPAIVMC